MPLLEALKLLNRLDQNFAVVKRGQREIGMVGEQRIKEVLAQTNREFADTSMNETFDNLTDKYQGWRQKINNSKSSLSNGNNGSRYSQSANRISKDEYGQEISGISKRAEPSEFDSKEDIGTVSDYIMQYNN